MLCCKHVSSKLWKEWELYHFASLHNNYEINGLTAGESLLIKSKEAGQNPLSMMLYKNTPFGTSFLSPIGLMYGWKTRSDLPMSLTVKMKVGNVELRLYTYNQGSLEGRQQATHFLVSMLCIKYHQVSYGITNELQDSMSYIITAPDGTTHGCAKFYLKPFKPLKSMYEPKISQK